MAVTRRHAAAPPEDVWAILADAEGYAAWVVGAYAIRGVDGDWPEPGSTFHHTQGRPPLKIDDTTTVVEAEQPRRLVLEVRARPLVVARVELTLEPDGEGTRITIDERPHGGVLGVLGPLNAPALALRNEEALRRLCAMAWARKAGRLAAHGDEPDDAPVATGGKTTS